MTADDRLPRWLIYNKRAIPDQGTRDVINAARREAWEALGRIKDSMAVQVRIVEMSLNDQQLAAAIQRFSAPTAADAKLADQALSILHKHGLRRKYLQ